jgi:1,4-alpha-glucan branching enzyme
MSSAATHGYLPLFATDEAIEGQIRTGLRAHARHFGRPARAFWLPECAYRPAYLPDAARPEAVRPGLESFLAEHGVRVTFVETHAIEGGRPVGKSAEAVVGYAPVPARTLVAPLDAADPGEMSTYHAYRLGDSAVAVLGRDNRTSMQVWAAETGYPGDAAYREFHRKDPVSGLQYWRVTGPGVGLGGKALYDPAAAEARIDAHADHFAATVSAHAADLAERHGGGGMIVAMYDTELFGHWWFEGPRWLVRTLRRLAASGAVQVTTPADWVAEHPPERAAAVPESSWGTGGAHHTWSNEKNAWVWPLLHAAEMRLTALADRFPAPDADRRIVLEQAARELLLMQSSDWPFLIATGQAAEYATLRFTEHAAKFHRLAFAAGAPETSAAVLDETAQIAEQDNVFPDLSIDDWRSRPA